MDEERPGDNTKGQRETIAASENRELNEVVGISRLPHFYSQPPLTGFFSPLTPVPLAQSAHRDDNTRAFKTMNSKQEVR
jgi:hypothetical protein